MGLYVKVDSEDFRKLIDKFDKAGKGELKQQLLLFLQALGDDFLRVVQDEIIRKKTVDTRLLLNSFQKGAEGNLYILNEGDLSLEIGTNVEYAQWADKGHNTNPPGVETRWVPGVWKGKRFVYDPSKKTGMLLKQHWVEGSHYWESAIDIMYKMMPTLLYKKIQEWIDSYFA